MVLSRLMLHPPVTGSGPSLSMSQRFLMNSYGTNDYALINHLKLGDGFLSPVGTAFQDPTKPSWPQLLDAQGYPNTDVTVQGNHNFGSGLRIPDPTNYGGPILTSLSINFASNIVTVQTSAPHTWKSGQDITLDSVVPSAYNGTFKIVSVPDSTHFTYGLAGGNPGTVTSQGNVGQYYVVSWTGTGTCVLAQGSCINSVLTTAGILSSGGTFSGTNVRIVFSWNPSVSTPNYAMVHLCNFTVTSSGSAGSNFIKNIAWYRLGDETDYLAGKLMRRDYLKTIAILNPSCIRFMGVQGFSTDGQVRWEDRATPDNAGYGGGFGMNWLTSPKYNAATQINNDYSLAAVTTGKITPAAMTHGERATFLNTVTTTRPLNTSGITSITIVDGVTIEVTTSAVHNQLVGDKIVFTMPNGMVKLNRFPTTITTVPSTTVFRCTVPSTSGYPAFNASGCKVQNYITLNVGGRGAFPVVGPDGLDGAQSGNGGISSGYNHVFFDKWTGVQDGNGNYVLGAWCIGLAHSGYPIELAVQTINELMDYYDSVGITKPTNLWLNVPPFGMSSMDPDYNSTSNYAINMVNTVLNGSVINGVTYEGLDSRCTLFVERGNEWWNTAGPGFWGANNAANKSLIRWPTLPSGQLAWSTMITSYNGFDIKNAFPGNTRVQVVCGGWFNNAGSTFGPSGANNNNNQRCTAGGATAIILTDPLWPVPGKLPKDFYDCFAVAPYMSNNGTYFSNTASGLRDNAAQYFGTDNSGVLTFTADTGGLSSKQITISAPSSTINPMQTFVYTGSATNPPATILFQVSGTTGGAGIYQLASALTLSSVACTSTSGGGNYIGASNNTAAVTSFFNAFDTANANNPLTGGPNAQISNHSTGVAALGLKLVEYEGGPDWPYSGNPGGTQNMSIADGVFMTKVVDSPLFATRYLSYVNAWNANANHFMPAVLNLTETRWLWNTLTLAPYLFNGSSNQGDDTYFNGIEGGGFSFGYQSLGAFNSAYT